MALSAEERNKIKNEKQAQMLRENLKLRQKQIQERQKLEIEKEQSEKNG